MNNEPISNNNIQDDQVILKTVFNRGVKKGRPELANDLINSLDTKIKVNLEWRRK